MALSPLFDVKAKQSLSIRKICFYNNDEKTDMLPIYGVWKEFFHRCGYLKAEHLLH
jgi:hypothetical protein